MHQIQRIKYGINKMRVALSGDVVDHSSPLKLSSTSYSGYLNSLDFLICLPLTTCCLF